MRAADSSAAPRMVGPASSTRTSSHAPAGGPVAVPDGRGPRYLLVSSILYPSAGGGSVNSIEIGVVSSERYLSATLGDVSFSFVFGSYPRSFGFMYRTLNHPVGAPDPLSYRLIPAVIRLNRPLEIGPVQDTRKLFPLDGSGTNSRIPSFNGWPSRVTVPEAGTRLTPHPATPTRAASRAHPTPARALSNRELIPVTSGREGGWM